LSAVIQRQKMMGNAIGDEVDQQNGMYFIVYTLDTQKNKNVLIRISTSYQNNIYLQLLFNLFLHSVRIPTKMNGN